MLLRQYEGVLDLRMRSHSYCFCSDSVPKQERCLTFLQCRVCGRQAGYSIPKRRTQEGCERKRGESRAGFRGRLLREERVSSVTLRPLT